MLVPENVEPSAHYIKRFVAFYYSRTVLLLLKMVIEYCQCADDIPAVAADLLTRLVDLLKVN